MKTKTIPELSQQDKDRFWSKVKKLPNGCYEWIIGKDKDGYGRFKIQKGIYRAHRISYFLKHGKISTVLQLDHLCRNPSCVNPDHLEEVTQ